MLALDEPKVVFACEIEFLIDEIEACENQPAWTSEWPGLDDDRTGGAR
jgi:hypothetical protein